MGSGSDADLSLVETGDAIAWWPSAEAPEPRPNRLPGYAPEPRSAQAPGQRPVQAPPARRDPAPDRVLLTPTTGDYAVQFASYTSEERAWQGWDWLQGEATELLNVIKPMVLRADLGAGAGVVYRLRSVPTPQAVAERLCDALQDRGVDCLVVRSEPALAETGTTG